MDVENQQSRGSHRGSLGDPRWKYFRLHVRERRERERERDTVLLISLTRIYVTTNENFGTDELFHLESLWRKFAKKKKGRKLKHESHTS